MCYHLVAEEAGLVPVLLFVRQILQTKNILKGLSYQHEFA
jgi:hypothetical protein